MASQRTRILQLLNTPAATLCPIRSTISGQIALTYTDPSLGSPAGDRSLVMRPGTTYNILLYAPASWWRASASLLDAANNGLVEVDEAALAGPSPPPVLIPQDVPAATFVALVNGQSSDAQQFEVVGGFVLDGTKYREIRFSTLAAVTGVGLTGEIALFNLESGTQVALHTYAGLTQPSPLVSNPLPLPSSTATYEVRQRVLGGLPPNDRIFTTWAGLQLIPA